MTANYDKNCSRNITKRGFKKESKTDMESVTFEASIKVVAITI